MNAFVRPNDYLTNRFNIIYPSSFLPHSQFSLLVMPIMVEYSLAFLVEGVDESIIIIIK